MNRQLKAGLIAVLLLLTLSPGRPEKWMAHADGASDPQELWVEWRHTGNEGYTGEQGNGLILDDTTQVSEYNLTYQYEEINASAIGIYYYRAYIWSDDADTRDWDFCAYNYTGEADGHLLIDYTTVEISEAPGDSAYSWRTYAFSQVMINDTMGMVGDDWVFFFGIADDGDTGTMYLSKGLNPGGDTSGQKLYDGDPLPAEFGEDLVEAWLPPAQIRFWGYLNTTTNYNQYVGNVTHNVPRYDINYTFPVDVDNERIRITYPVSEQIFNITRYNGGAWDTVLDAAEYSTETLNATHNILTIPEATINLYGGIYRVFTSTFDYLYQIGGAFYENGTSYGAVNITATYEGGSTPYLVDGPTEIGTDTEIILFQWDVGTAVRFYYTRSSQEAFNIYFPEDTYATYEFEVRDLTGDLQSYDADSHLESLRYINNSLEVVERVAIADVVNDVPLTLVTYQVYRLRVLTPGETIYNFGIMVTGVITDPVLIIDEIAFSAQAQITYQYVTVEASRPIPSQITVNYNDSLAQTTEVSFYLEFRNGTDVYNETVAEDNYQFNWAGADSYTDYKVTVVITHELFGTLTHDEIIGVERTFNPPPDWGIMGTVGPIATGNLISILIISVLALAFSAVNAETGGFVAVSAAYILRYWGWNTFDYTTITICMGIVIVFGMVRRSTG